MRRPRSCRDRQRAHRLDMQRNRRERGVRIREAAAVARECGYTIGTAWRVWRG